MVMLANTQGIADTHPQTEDGAGPVLTLSGISKSFPGVKALSEVSLELFPGEVTALVGENGAGKSTIVKILTGIYQPDEAQSRSMAHRSPSTARTRRAG